MKKKSVIILIIAIVIIAITAITFGILNSQDKTIVKLENQIAYLKEEIVPMEFEIKDNSNSQIKIKMVFYDLDGNKKNTKAYQLKGDELHIDFKVVDFSENAFLFFPYALYSNKIPPVQAIRICDFYNKDDFPSIYDGIESVDMKFEDKSGLLLDSSKVKSLRKELSKTYDLVLSGKDISEGDSYGVAIHEMKSLARFKMGLVYKVVCHPHTGAIEIIGK